MADDNPKSTFETVRLPVSTETITSVVSSTGTASVVLGFNLFDTATKPPEKPAEDHKIYSLIGRVANDWAHVEHTLDLLIWDLALVDPDRGSCITAQMLGVYNRCKTIIALLKLIAEKTGTDMRKHIAATTDVMNRQSEPGDKRNRIVHDPWYSYTNKEQVAQFKAMAHKDWRYGITPIDNDVLQDALDSIKNFSERVTNLRTDISATLKSLR
jgi:hypothetical protein